MLNYLRSLVVTLALTKVYVSGLRYMPGVRPHEFSEGEDVPMKVNSVTSIHTQLPKDFYRLPFCKPFNGAKPASENLSEFLTGNKIQTSAYAINMKLDSYCKLLCQVTLDKVQTKLLKLHIHYAYHNNWLIDNLPSASLAHSNGSFGSTYQTHYAGGFPIGFVDPKKQQQQDNTDKRHRPQYEFARFDPNSDDDVYVYNHVNIFLDYHQPDPSTPNVYRVVGFKVEPLSIAHRFQSGYIWDGLSPEGFVKTLATCPSTGAHMTKEFVQLNQIVAEGQSILYTYDVIWNYSDVPWSSRWDVYLTEDHLVPPQVHWYAISNSLLVVLFLAVLMTAILLRSLRRDISSYNSRALMSDEEMEDTEAETGWKLVHADVFRPPHSFPMLFAAMTGSGIQIAIAVLGCIILAAVGFLNPSKRGSFLNYILIFYMLCGILAGYVSSRLFKAFRGRAWQLCTILTATIFPGLCFATFLFFNVILFFFHSSGSVPFLEVLIMAAMWCCVSIPLVFVGAFFGYKAPTISYPTVTSTIARAIPPPQNILLNPYFCVLMGGIVPFASAYVELFFIMTSLWMDQYYYVFGFTLIVFLILILSCSELTILFVYYQLCSENHRWWWFSFFSGGSVAVYMFLYSIAWFQVLQPSTMIITYMLYFGYMFLLSLGLFLVCGAISALMSLWFVRVIFSYIKVD